MFKTRCCLLFSAIFFMSHSAPPHFAIQLCCPTLFHLKLLCACMSFTPCFYSMCVIFSLCFKNLRFIICAVILFLSIYWHYGSISLSLVCLSVQCNLIFLLFYEGEIMFFVFDHQNGEINTKHILSVYSITSNKYSWDLKSEHCVFQSAFRCCEFGRCSKSFKNITIPRNFLEIHQDFIEKRKNTLYVIVKCDTIVTTPQKCIP